MGLAPGQYGQLDDAHETIIAMGCAGSERTTRRAVAQLKANRAAGRRRVFCVARLAYVGAQDMVVDRAADRRGG